MNWLGGAKKRLRLMGCSSQNYDVSNFQKKQVKLSYEKDYINKNEQDPLFNRFYYKDQLLPKYLNEKEEKNTSVVLQQQQASEEKDQLGSFKFKKKQKNNDILLTEPKKSSKVKIWTTSNSELKTRSDIKEIFKSSSFTGPVSAVLRSESKRNKELELKPNIKATKMDF